jgi:malate dehydrogenase (oxaloacetate-decarboxylating)(NADP+)
LASGGINLEDIKAPECFYVEKECQRRMNIPVFHDDQHGTAIIAGAGLVNALELVGKQAADVRVVVCGCGAAGFTCALHFIELGVLKHNLICVDLLGVVYEGREDLVSDPEKCVPPLPPP